MSENAHLHRAYWLAVVAAFVVGLILRSETFFLTWTGVHNAWGGAFYGNVARNFLRYGYLATEFAPMVGSGLIEPAEFEFYYHHPPMVMWLTSVSFMVFGIHEWSARLAPLVFSLLTMGLVFVFAREAFGRGVALCALSLMAVLPVDAYYATQVDPNGSMSIFFTALVVEGYRRWLATRCDRYMALSAVAVVLGCMTGWFTYLVIPGVVLHLWFFHRTEATEGPWTRLWVLPVCAVGVFALFMLHRQIALSGARPEVFDSLSDRLLKRTVNFELDRLMVVKIHLRNIWDLYTVPIVALSGAWLVLFIRDVFRGRSVAANWCIAIMLSYGVIYGLVFPGHLISHDFFARMYAPGAALASAVVIMRLAGMIPASWRRTAATSVLVGLVCTVAAMRTRSLYAADYRGNGPLLAGFGEVVGGMSTLSDPVFLPIDADAILQFYVDRPMLFDLDTPEELEAATAEVSGPYLVLVPERDEARFPELLAYLRGRYEESRERGLLIFRPAGDAIE